MSELSFDPFRNLLAHIRPYSPRAAEILEQMRTECDQQSAYYAAFILICLQATREISRNKPLAEYSAADFQDFAFFAVANECALALFDELLLAYHSGTVTAPV
ncbi:MAG: hypothetical protein ABI835_11205 [Chloroflexota bacterium]